MGADKDGRRRGFLAWLLSGLKTFAGIMTALATIATASATPAVVYVETLAGDLYLEARTDVTRYTLAFDRLLAAALHPDDSMRLVEQAADALT